MAASRSLGQARQSPPTQRESLPPSQHSSSGSCCVGAVEARDTCREPAPDSREERGPTPRSVSDRSDKTKAEYFDNTVMSDYLDVASDVENMCVEEGGVDIFLEDKDNVMHGRLRKCTGFWREIGASQWVLDILENGYRLPFVKKPPVGVKRKQSSCKEHEQFVDEAVAALVQCGSAAVVTYAYNVHAVLRTHSIDRTVSYSSRTHLMYDTYAFIILYL